VRPEPSESICVVVTNGGAYVVVAKPGNHSTSAVGCPNLVNSDRIRCEPGKCPGRQEPTSGWYERLRCSCDQQVPLRGVLLFAVVVNFSHSWSLTYRWGMVCVPVEPKDYSEIGWWELACQGWAQDHIPSQPAERAHREAAACTAHDRATEMLAGSHFGFPAVALVLVWDTGRAKAPGREGIRRPS